MKIVCIATVVALATAGLTHQARRPGGAATVRGFLAVLSLTSVMALAGLLLLGGIVPLTEFFAG